LEYGLDGLGYESQQRERITLDNKFKKKIVSEMNMLLMYLLASMKVKNGHKKILGSSFEIMLPLWYFIN
jgi:hypothetical protein